MFYLAILFLTLVFTVGYYFLGVAFSVDKIYFSLATFLFSIFNGFFISRQASRYNDIRNTLSKIDANFSTIYRHSMHLSKFFQNKLIEVLQSYYKKRKKNLNSYIDTKSSLISELHELIKKEMQRDLKGIEIESVKKVLNMTDDIQQHRKLLIALSEEKISDYQYTIVILLAGVLFLNLFLINSEMLVIESLMKGVFSTIILVVLWTLNRFDNLKIFMGKLVKVPEKTSWK